MGDGDLLTRVRRLGSPDMFTMLSDKKYESALDCCMTVSEKSHECACRHEKMMENERSTWPEVVCERVLLGAVALGMATA